MSDHYDFVQDAADLLEFLERNPAPRRNGVVALAEALRAAHEAGSSSAASDRTMLAAALQLIAERAGYCDAAWIRMHARAALASTASATRVPIPCWACGGPPDCVLLSGHDGLHSATASAETRDRVAGRIAEDAPQAQEKQPYPCPGREK